MIINVMSLWINILVGCSNIYVKILKKNLLYSSIPRRIPAKMGKDPTFYKATDVING